MTQIGEAISLSVLSHEGHDEGSCAFCNASPEPTSEKNTLTDNYDEDANEVPGVNSEGIEHKNSSGDLGKNLIKAGYEQKFAEIGLHKFSRSLPAKFTDPLKVSSAAHHLIPGNASLVKSKIKKYLHTDGMAEGNIGYNVNNFENGVWLAGNYALRGKNGMPKWGPGGSLFTAQTQLAAYEYAKNAIEQTSSQFHDSHSDYSNLVIKTLDLIAKKYKVTGDVWCTESSKSESDKPPQLPMLVMRLNTVSRRLKSKLQNPSKKWSKNVFTSGFSRDYIDNEIHKST